MHIDFRLYLITDRKQTKQALPEAVRQALEGGVRAIQLREKDLPVRELLSLAEKLRSLTWQSGSRLFINDRADVAVAVEADGVHLGGQSMPPSAVRKIVGDKMMIGASIHSVEEAIKAQSEGADFVTFGPIFKTPFKEKYGMPVGLNELIKAKNTIRIPIFAIGGINSGNIKHIMGSGLFGIAMISAIFAADNIRASAERINDIIEGAAAE